MKSIPHRKPRTKAQNKTIHALLNSRRIDADLKAEMVYRITGGRTTHSSEMYFSEANQLITELGGTPHDAGLRTVQHYRRQAGVTQIITSQQRQILRALCTARWGSDYNAPYQALCLRTLKKSEPVTSPDAQKIIEAIKSMNSRDAQKRA
ncbi:MAG TPA: hypothetical protein VEF04_04605 [Blastocatellia bacterium]|nr:hypothetical protein [Blastocatellia bacterium]